MPFYAALCFHPAPPSLVKVTSRSACVYSMQNIGRNACGYVRSEWVWSPAGAAYSLTPSVPEREQSPQPALLCCSHTYNSLPLCAAYIGQRNILTCKRIIRMQIWSVFPQKFYRVFSKMTDFCSCPRGSFT